MKITYDSFAEKLREHVVGFSDLYDQHVRDNDEVLPHVLMGDLVDSLADRVHAEGAGSQAVRVALDLLERGMQAEDERLQELISVSFLEDLDPEDTSFSQLEALMGPGLRHQLEKYKEARRAPPG
jgi:hypothetical protein